LPIGRRRLGIRPLLDAGWCGVRGTGERPRKAPRRNFHEYLIGRDGHIAAVSATEMEPIDARVIDAIVKERQHAE
jgi:glutathione peroxidase-family protein